ncbi:MAG: hypothetical protein ACOVQR_10810, partial [Flavobacterium sp.]|uniref:hypothetical protein n=1 Tax=Flavobacterium sp. TaxID=239 RepID=UPI003BA542E6
MIASTGKEASNALKLLYLISLIFVLYVLKPVIVPVLISILISVFIFPFVKILEQKFHFNRVVSAIFTLILLSILTLAVLTFIGLQLYDIVEKG